MTRGSIAAEHGDTRQSASAQRPVGKDEHGPSPLSGLADALAGMLPSGSKVVVRWLDPEAGSGLSAAIGAPSGLLVHADRRLADRAEPDDERSVVWENGQTRIVVAANVTEPLESADFQSWMAVARHTIDASLASARAQARIESLEKAQRLQQALYEIADLAGSGLEMDEMLRRIHDVVGGLMYARNFFIVTFDPVREAVRFLYFADALDPYVAEPGVEIPIGELSNSLTVALLHHGQPLLGPSAVLRRELGVEVDLSHGPDSADWLGVPMRRDDRVSGAIVVQSYDRPGMYSQEDRALLEYVAQHIQTALDRKHAQVELERRVYERTLELQQANLVLQAEIVERKRAERLQRALYKITELSVTTGSLEKFYADVHELVGELLYARNFYIALLTPDGEQIEFPYSVDERDPTRVTRNLGNGLTEYVITHGDALLADRARIADLEAAGSVRSHGALAQSWLGVPLVRESTVVGAIVVQSYTGDIVFTPRDQELLTFVAHHIGGGLARKRTQEHLKAAHSELEFRVEARTQELAGANRELRAQIGERMRAEQRLTHQARHDALTGLPNRPHLLERLHDAGKLDWSKCAIDGTNVRAVFGG